MIPPLIANRDIDDFKEKVGKYVLGGACDPTQGTKKHPYSSLAQAEADASWEVLVVLSSHTPLDGGITLKVVSIKSGKMASALVLIPFS